MPWYLLLTLLFAALGAIADALVIIDWCKKCSGKER